MACKACRQRKVRCDGRPNTACRQCTKHDLACTYEQPKDRSRLGATRGTVIASCSTSSPSPSSSASSSSGFLWLSDDFFLDLLPRFHEYIYPLCPVITEEELRHHVHRRHISEDSAALIHAWAAMTVWQRSHLDEVCSNESADEDVSMILSQALRQYRPFNSESFTFTRLMGSLFIAWCMLCIGKGRTGFFYFRQTISMLHILQMGSDDTNLDDGRLNIIYWLCFIHERSMALLWKTPICLGPIETLPTFELPLLERSFHQLIKTWILVDNTFLSAWGSESSIPVTKEWIEQKNFELNDESWFLEAEQLPIVHQADLIITRQWLKTLLWQVAIQNVQLSSQGQGRDSLTLTTPLHVFSQTRALLKYTALSHFTMHAFAHVYKLFEVATTLGDVLLQLPPSEDQAENQQRIDDFLLAKNFLLSLPTVKSAHRDALTERHALIEEKYIIGRCDLTP